MGYNFKLKKIIEIINFHSKLVDGIVDSSYKKHTSTLPACDQINALESDERIIATKLRDKLSQRIKKYVK